MSDPLAKPDATAHTTAHLDETDFEDSKPVAPPAAPDNSCKDIVAPPSYEEVSAAKSNTTPRSFAHQNAMPTALNIYKRSTVTRKWLILGPHQNTPLFNVQFNEDKYDLALHDGPTISGKRLGLLMKTDKTSSMLGASELDGCNVRTSITKRIQAKWSEWHLLGAPVRSEGAVDMHAFYWRPSQGAEVTLAGGKEGWKLVYYGPPGALDLTKDPATGGARGQRDFGRSSDGREVVAAYAAHPGFGGAKKGTFRFIGRGATEEFGEQFKRFAVISLVRMWQLKDREDEKKRTALIFALLLGCVLVI